MSALDPRTRAVLVAALDVASDPPAKASKYGSTFYVSRDHIDALRLALEAYGVDWLAVCKAKHPRAPRRPAGGAP